MNQPASIYQLFDVLQQNVPSIRGEQLNEIQDRQGQIDFSTEEEISAILQRTKSSVDGEYTAYSYRARVSFLLSLTATTLAIILIFVGSTLIFASNTSLTTALAITFTGVAVNIISTLILGYVRAINNRRDEVTRQLRILDKTSTAMDYISRFSTEEKEEAIDNLVEQLSSSAASESKVKNSTPLATNPEEVQVLEVFANPKYNWWTIEGIAKETGLPPDDIIRVLKSNDQIIRGTAPDKQGRALYATKSYYKSRKNVLNHILSVLSDQIK